MIVILFGADSTDEQLNKSCFAEVLYSKIPTKIEI